MGVEDGLQVVQGLLGLGLDVSLHDGAGAGVNGHLAGDKEEVADLDGLGVGADGGGGAVSVDDLLHRI